MFKFHLGRELDYRTRPFFFLFWKLSLEARNAGSVKVSRAQGVRASLSLQTFCLTVLASSLKQNYGPFYSLLVDSTYTFPYIPLSLILSLTIAVYPITFDHAPYALCARIPVCPVCPHACITCMPVCLYARISLLINTTCPILQLKQQQKFVAYLSRNFKTFQSCSKFCVPTSCIR